MNVKDRHIKFYRGKDISWVNWGKSFYPHLDLIKPKSVCDVGCGNGKFLKDMVTKYGCTQAYGVDIATVELGMVITDPRITYFSSDSTKIPLEDKSVDLVTSFDCLEHVAEDKVEKTLKEFARISRKGFMFSITHRLSGHSVGEYNLHSCVKSKDWWFNKIKTFMGAKLEKTIYAGGNPSFPHTETIWKL